VCNSKISFFNNCDIKLNKSRPTCNEQSPIIPAGACLNFYHCNVQSIRNKLSEIDLFLTSVKCDILTLNEHWLFEDESDLYIPSGYKLVSICNRDNSCARGGGSAIYVKQDILAQSLDVKEFYLNSIFEVTAIIIPNSNVIVTTLYRTPNSNLNHFFNVLESFLLYLSKKYVGMTYILTADFNIDILEKSQIREYFLNILRSFNIYWLNEEPTRGDKCLDNILTNFDRRKVNCSVIEPHLSDHSGVYAQFRDFNFNSRTDNNVATTTRRNLSHKAIISFRSKLSQIDWNFLEHHCDADQAFDKFNLLLTNSFNECCSVKTFKVSHHKRTKIKWYKPELRLFKKYVTTFYDRYKNSKGTANEIVFKQDYLDIKRKYKNEVNNCKKAANEQYIKNSSNQCKAAWNLIKAESSYKINKPRQERVIDSDTFNNYFINIVNDLNSSKGSCDVSQDQALELVNNFVSQRNLNENLFTWQQIQTVDIIKCINRLSNSCSEDYYGFSNKVLKEIVGEIANPLTFLFNKMLEEGTYPQALKLSKVIPIYKKGDKLNPSSYRPISLVPIISKVFESCIKRQINTYFINNNLFCEEQFGFVPGKNTIKAVEMLTSRIIENFEKKLISSALLIDLTKAFDCINHEVLKQKLYCYGIRGKELKLLSSFLSNRAQMVVQGKDKSLLKSIETGVPQGSVLGPLLFIIAVNDFAGNIPCPSILYADDTTLFNHDKYLDNLIEQEKNALDVALNWFSLNSLVVNNQKTEGIVFSLDYTVYSRFKPVKLLGIHIDSRLSWDSHCEQLCRKLSRVIFLLRKLRTNVTPSMMITAYYAFFHSHISYGITLWGNSCGAQIVFKWQKKALRTIKNVSNRDSCVPIFKEYKIMSLPNLYVYSCLMDVKKSLCNFPVRNNIHSYPTRNNYQLDTFTMRLEKTKGSHVYMKIKIFNKLPRSAWYVPLKRFENVISKWLKETVFYSLDEYLNSDTSVLNVYF
jgi:hypothetical protein